MTKKQLHNFRNLVTVPIQHAVLLPLLLLSPFGFICGGDKRSLIIVYSDFAGFDSAWGQKLYAPRVQSWLINQQTHWLVLIEWKKCTNRKHILGKWYIDKRIEWKTDTNYMFWYSWNKTWNKCTWLFFSLFTNDCCILKRCLIRYRYTHTLTLYRQFHIRPSNFWGS